MMGLLRAELRKLITVRSTYIILTIAAFLISFLAFYVWGYSSIHPNPFWLSNMINDTSTVVAMFLAIIAILLMCHEYRHNTIMYTLTYSNSRTKVLLSKVLVVAAFALGMTLVMTLFGILMYRIGVALSPRAEFVSPEFMWSDVLRSAFFVLAYTMIGLVLGALLRHVAGAIAALLIIPTVEQILTLLLKENSKYLPFMSLERVHSHIASDARRAMLVLTVYLIAAWLLAWYLFRRRDAN